MRFAATLLASLIGFVQVTSAGAQTVQQRMNSVAPKPINTGYSASIIRSGEIVYTGRGGNPDPGPNARYMLASVSKQFTAAGILALEAEGKLSLSDPVSSHLTAYPHWSEIKVRDLLSHRTNLPDYVSMQPYTFGAAVSSSTTISGILNLIAGMGTPSKSPCIRYSNTNYTALAAIIQAASGKSFGQYLKEAVFEPLSMDQTSYSGAGLSTIMKSNGSAVYQSSWANGAGGIVSSARDMAKWNAGIIDGFLDIKSRVQSDKVTGGCSPFEPQAYAYGWIPIGLNAMYHSGMVPEGYASFNYVNVGVGKAVAVLSNYAGYSKPMESFAMGLLDAPLGSPSDTGGTPSLPPGWSLTCKYTHGPKAGQTQTFPIGSATPAPIGGTCSDGASLGQAI